MIPSQPYSAQNICLALIGVTNAPMPALPTYGSARTEYRSSAMQVMLTLRLAPQPFRERMGVVMVMISVVSVVNTGAMQ
jgi:hypothetical protein